MRFQLPISLLMFAAVTLSWQPASAFPLHGGTTHKSPDARVQLEQSLIETSRASECAYKAATLVIDRVSRRIADSKADAANNQHDSAILTRALQVSKLAVEQAKTSYFIYSNLDRFRQITALGPGAFSVDGQQFIGIARAGDALNQQTAPVTDSQLSRLADQIENGAPLACTADYGWDDPRFERYSFSLRDWIVRTGVQRAEPQPQLVISDFFVTPADSHTLAAAPNPQLSSISAMR